MKIVYKWLHAFVASHILQKVFIVLCGFGALFTMEFTFSMEIMKNSEGFMNIGLELLTWNTCFSNLNKTLKTHINPGVMSGTKMFHMQLCILTVHQVKPKSRFLFLKNQSTISSTEKKAGNPGVSRVQFCLISTLHK